MSDIFTCLKGLVFPHGKKVVFEIGAADGGDTYKIMNAIDPEFLGVEYYAFEPDPRNIAKIKASSLVSIPGYHLIEAAVGNKNKIQEFNLSGGSPDGCIQDWSFSSSLKQPKGHLQEHPWCEFKTTIPVKVIRLGSFCYTYSIDVVDFIWADIQGAEDLMLDGEIPVARYLYTECYETEVYEGQIGRQEILKRLGPAWRIHTEWPHDVLFENTDVLK